MDAPVEEGASRRSRVLKGDVLSGGGTDARVEWRVETGHEPEMLQRVVGLAEPRLTLTVTSRYGNGNSRSPRVSTQIFAVTFFLYLRSQLEISSSLKL